MSFSVKDFWSYTDDSTTLKSVVMLVAKPGGGGFSLINMTKEEFFNIADDMTLRFNPSAGTIDLIEFDQLNSVVLKYLAGGQIAIFDGMANLGLSDNGTTNKVGMSIVSGNGRLYAGTASNVEGEILIYDTNGDLATITAALTADQDIRFNTKKVSTASTVDVKYRQDDQTVIEAPSDGGTTTLPEGANSVHIAESAGISSHTFDFPANPDAGDRITLTILSTITTITMNAPGATTIVAPFTTATTGLQSRSWAYDAVGDRWVRFL